MRRGLLSACAVVATAAGILMPAQAMAVPEKLTAPGFMLAPQDVPAALGAPKPGRNNYTVDNGTTSDMGLCVPKTGGPELTVSGAAGWLTTVVLTGTGYREVNERLSTFASTGAAASTFATLQAEAAQCNGMSSVPISDDSSHPVAGRYKNTNSSGTTGDGVWISIDTKVNSTDPRIDGSVTTTYTVFRQSLNAITQTWVYFNGTKTTTAKQRRAVNALALELTNNLTPS